MFEVLKKDKWGVVKLRFITGKSKRRNVTLDTNFLYCCTVHFEDSLSIAHQQMH
jgi:hypothetical protein